MHQLLSVHTRVPIFLTNLSFEQLCKFVGVTAIHIVVKLNATLSQSVLDVVFVVAAKSSVTSTTE